MPSRSLQHLSPTAREWVDVPIELRVRYTNRDHWIEHPLAISALSKLESLLALPRRSRMPCLLLFGESGMGKTMILEKFARSHPPPEAEYPAFSQRDIVFMQMPPMPRLRNFYEQLLKAFDPSLLTRGRTDYLESTTLAFLARIQPKM
jgi:hypothetical protein